jgi:hypothetical protein
MQPATTIHPLTIFPRDGYHRVSAVGSSFLDPRRRFTACSCYHGPLEVEPVPGRERRRVRLPFPERVPLIHVIVFAIVLCTLQIYQGTAPLFSLCSFLFIIVAAIAFNVAGGITRPSGAYILSYAVLGVIIGLTWKAVLGEPADSNLQIPMVTIEVYLASICSMLGAVFVSRRLTTKRALLANFVTDETMQGATLGCLVTGLVLTIILTLVPRSAREPGSILSGLQQLNRFLSMAIFLGVIHAIKRSGGTSSVSLPVLIAGGVTFVIGILGFSKEGIITPFVCWLVAAASQRYKVSLPQIAGAIFVAFFISQYLVPYSQYGRNFGTASFSSNLDVSIAMLSDLGAVRRDYEGTEVDDEQEQLVRGYFTNHQGFFDRLQMIGPDDSLIALTESGTVEGLTPLYIGFANLVPHFIWKNKPSMNPGNFYAHQMGYLADEDDTTGISFSPAGEAFHLMRWTGVFIVAPLLWIMLFAWFDSLCGDVRKSPWGLLIMVVFAHAAPEGGIGIVIYTLGYGTIALVFAAFAATYLMPIFGEIVAGPSRRTIRLPDPVKQPLRPRPVDPPATAAG